MCLKKNSSPLEIAKKLVDEDKLDKQAEAILRDMIQSVEKTLEEIEYKKRLEIYQKIRDEIRKRDKGEVVEIEDSAVCPFCGKNFESKGNMGEHLKKEHKKIAVDKDFLSDTEIKFLESKLRGIDGIGDTIAKKILVCVFTGRNEEELEEEKRKLVYKDLSEVKKSVELIREEKKSNQGVIDFSELERRIGITKNIPSRSVGEACRTLIEADLSEDISELKSELEKRGKSRLPRTSKKGKKKSGRKTQPEYTTIEVYIRMRENEARGYT